LPLILAPMAPVFSLTQHTLALEAPCDQPYCRAVHSCAYHELPNLWSKLMSSEAIVRRALPLSRPFESNGQAAVQL